MNVRHLSALCAAIVAAWFFITPDEAESQVPLTAEQITLSFAPVVKKAAPAVVNIYTKRVVKERVNVSPFMNDPVFRQLFGNNPMATGPVREKVERSLGSGVIVTADGMVVTAHHVVKNAQEITIVLSDRRELEAKIVKRDPKTDLAFLQIDAKEKLPFIEMRDSDTLEVGELALAIGNPFGVGQTVTQGIISALPRAAAGVSDYQFFIQTDAAINPGNSGGALVDMGGKLIGVNTAIYSTSGGSNGIGFAITSNTVRAVQESQVLEGRVLRPWIGVGAQPVTTEIAESMGLKSARGALVRKIVPGSPADKAGLKEGDIIIGFNNSEVSDDKALIYRLGTAIIGRPLQLKLLRQGVEQVLTVTPAQPPKEEAKPITLKGMHPLSGAIVADIVPSLAQELGMDDMEQEGVIVLGGKTSGLVALQKGDIIRQVNGKPVENVRQLEALLAAKVRAWSIVVQRGGGLLQLNIRI